MKKLKLLFTLGVLWLSLSSIGFVENNKYVKHKIELKENVQSTAVVELKSEISKTPPPQAHEEKEIEAESISEKLGGFISYWVSSFATYVVEVIKSFFIR